MASPCGLRIIQIPSLCIFSTHCADQRLIYLAIHNHGELYQVGISGDDLRSHERRYRDLLDIANGMPVSVLVFAEDAIAGSIWLPSETRIELGVPCDLCRCIDIALLA